MTYRRGLIVALALVLWAVTCQLAWSQANIGAGSIQGVVSDPQGRAVPDATVTISQGATGRVITTSTNSAGAYSSGPVPPGAYVVRVEAAGFKTTEVTLNVVINVISTANVQLSLGSVSATIEVSSGAVSVDTDQAQVSGTLTADQIENLPINGRNFLDLAQLEPGVQIQDGENFDPTKTGFSSISFGGRFGRTARIEVDGLDVSDENVGTTTTNIPSDAIQEFQISQSSLDLSNELTSSGAVNVATKSGTNSIHGDAFGLFRDSSQGAGVGGGTYQRGQYGGDFGGAIVKDKLFYFVDGERLLQHEAAGLTFPKPFDVFDGTFNSPYRDFELLGKIDYQVTQNVHAFFRYNYFQNSLVPTYGPPSYSAFSNKDRTRNFAGGVDFSTGSFTHSFRLEYLKFVNGIGDAARGSGTPFSEYPVSLNFASNGFATGPSADAPQHTYQSDRQFKYDGSKVWRSHIIRYGFDYNHLLGGGYASFFGIAPTVYDFQNSIASGGSYDSYVGPVVTCPGGQTGVNCPLNYTPDWAYIGNGLGYSTEKPAFGKPFGAVGPDNRIGFYLGDSWKVRPNFTLLYGLRYVRDSGRTDSDLNTIQQVNNYFPGFGNPVRQPNLNFAPQIGLAWNVKGDAKTVVRAGAGIYYENTIWNNVLFDRPSRLQKGAFLSYLLACQNEVVQPVPFADGSTQFLPGGNATCSSAIGATLPAGTKTSLLDCSGVTTAVCIADFQAKFQASAAANPTSDNATYLPNEIANGQAVTGGAGTFDPNFKSPRSVQMNIGIQHEMRPGMLISVDYLRNVGTHYLLSIDQNHTGDAAYLNVAAATAAINATNASFGCADGAAGIPCAITAGASISDYATNGLDSPGDLNGGGQCGGGLPASYPVACAFGGINPQVGQAPFLSPIGRSVYNALDVKWQDNVANPFRGVSYLNFQFSYTLSRFQNSGSSSFGTPGTANEEDQDFIDNALDNRNPLRYMGDSTLDRTHQFNFGGYARVPGGIQVGIISHFWSPLAVTPLTTATGTAAIFQSDFTGSGVVADPLPIAQTNSTCGALGGSCDFSTYHVGAYGRSLGPAGLAKAVAIYNSKIAGSTITPAGQALVNAGLFTESQLIALGATPQAIATPPINQAPLGWMRAFDLELSYHHNFFGERLDVSPSVSFFNVFNLSNFDSPVVVMSGALSGNPNTINGTPTVGRTDRIEPGTGVFEFGAPRSIEWGLDFKF